jgi:hypothetical protein
MRVAWQGEGLASQEFWRGLGFASAMRTRCLEADACTATAAPRAAIAGWVWQGIGMAHGCLDDSRVIERAPQGTDADVQWGFGRGRAVCSGAFAELLAVHPADAFGEGVRAAWPLDLARPAGPGPSDADIPRFRTWSPTPWLGIVGSDVPD